MSTNEFMMRISSDLTPHCCSLDSDDDATVSIAKIKNKYKAGGAQQGKLNLSTPFFKNNFSR
jgi:hypothetical protein